MSQKHVQSNKISADIYQIAETIKRIEIIIKNELSQNNAKLILEYDKEMTRQSISIAARRIHLRALLNLTRMLKKDWKDVIKKDIEDLVFQIMETYSDERGQETWSTFDLKKVLKIFFRWHKLGSRSFKDVGDPQETRQVKLKHVRDSLAREDLITDDDLKKILKACGENQRDRTFIDCHSEAGTRPTEILSMQIKHVKFDKYGALLHVDGKTGTRPIRIIRSVPNLSRWLDIHPFKDNPDAPLWITLKKEKFGKPLSYRSATKMVQSRGKKAGITKKINLKLFRHTEATEAAKFMTESQLRMRHGWSNNSRMPDRYVHIVNSDVDEALFEHYGIKKSKKTDKKSPQFCLICKNANPYDSTICSQCGRPLDLKSAIEQEEKSANHIHQKKIADLESRINSFENEKYAIKKEVDSKIKDQSQVFEFMLDMFGMKDEFYQKKMQVFSHVKDLL